MVKSGTGENVSVGRLPQQFTYHPCLKNLSIGHEKYDIFEHKEAVLKNLETKLALLQRIGNGQLKFLALIRKRGLENLKVLWHIEDKRGRRKRRVTYLTVLCNGWQNRKVGKMTKFTKSYD